MGRARARARVLVCLIGFYFLIGFHFLILSVHLPSNYGDVTYNRFASHDRLAVQFKYVNRSRFISPEDIMESVISFILPT